jgi:multidrug efflux system membrane fusion protein
VVKDLPISEGAHVKAGDVIMALDPEDKPAMVEMAKQVVKQRQAELAAAKRLTQSGAAAKLQLDAAQFPRLRRPKSQLEGAKADLDRMTHRTRRSRHRSTRCSRNWQFGDAGRRGSDAAQPDPVIVKGEISASATLATSRSAIQPNVTFVEWRDGQGRSALYRSRGVAHHAHLPRRGRDRQSRQPHVGRHDHGNHLRAAPDRCGRAAALGGDPERNNGDLGIRAVDASARWFSIRSIWWTTRKMVSRSAGIPADAKVIVAGQDLVADGDMVNAGPADRSYGQEA